MLGTIPDRADVARLAFIGRASATQSGMALAVAFAVGMLSAVAPIGSVLILAMLGARALMRDELLRINPWALLGPALAALLVGAAVGVAGAMGVLFLWRLQADARWSAREAERLAILSGRPREATWRARFSAWLMPLYGLTLVAYTSPHMIAGLPLDLPHVPVWVPIAAACIAFIGVADWALRAAADWRLGELAAAPAAHLAAHHVIFLLAFGVTADVSSGIVAMIAWRLAHAAPLRLAQASFTAVP